MSTGKGKLLFLYDEDFRDIPYTKIEEYLAYYDKTTALRGHTLTVRFSSPSTIRCLLALHAEQKLSCDVEIWFDGNQATITDRSTIEPWLFESKDSSWEERQQKAWLDRSQVGVTNE